jgi:hypothetical protein
MSDAAAQPVGELVGTADHYRAFLELCRRRIEELRLTYESVDDLCGFPTRYTSKIMAAQKGISAHSIFTLCGALCLTPAFHHDEAQHAKLKLHSSWMMLRRPGPRWRKKASKIDSSRIGYPDFKHKRAQAGGLARARKLPRKRRLELARNAVRNRKWRPVRDKQNGGGSI